MPSCRASFLPFIQQRDTIGGRHRVKLLSLVIDRGSMQDRIDTQQDLQGSGHISISLYDIHHRR